MANPMIAAAVRDPGLRHFVDAHEKAQYPYGLPIVDKCETCKLRNGSFFCSALPNTIKAMDQIKHVSMYPEGALIFLEGEAARGVYILCQGRVKLLTTSIGGKTLILRIAQPGEIFGLNSVLMKMPHEITVETMQPSQLAFIGSENFLRFIKEHSGACLRVAQHLGRDCHLTYETIRSIGLSSSVSERLARLLVERAAHGQSREGMVRVKLALTHEEMAQLIGCSRESVSRTLSEFKRQRLLEQSGSTLLVRNKAALESLAAQ
jgi:CRP/FNR family transcriptional regulator, cyclic AMP receptor protein